VCGAGYAGGGLNLPCSPDLYDDCIGNHCGEGGSCMDIGVSLFSCECKAGYIGGGVGTNCTVDYTEDCVGDPKYICGNTGVCVDEGPNLFYCDCIDGYVGGREKGAFERCEVDWSDDCRDNTTCGSFGVCNDEGALSFSCTCMDGYKIFDNATNTFGQSAIDPLDFIECIASDKTLVMSALTATCPNELDGCVRTPACLQQLDTMLLPLDSKDDGSAGVNNGTVTVSLSPSEVMQLQLLMLCALRTIPTPTTSAPQTCMQATTGDVAPANGVFKAGGTCPDCSGGIYVPAGLSAPVPGSFCYANVSTNAPSPTLGSTAAAILRARALLRPSSPCESRPCQNRGQCVVAASSFVCVCAAGFAGGDCSQDIDDCTLFSCSNGGTCTDLVNGFECTCVPGWSGRTCDLSSRAASMTMQGIASPSQIAAAVVATAAASGQQVTANISFIRYTTTATIDLPGFDGDADKTQQAISGIAAALGVDPAAVSLQSTWRQRRRLEMEVAERQLVTAERSQRGRNGRTADVILRTRAKYIKGSPRTRAPVQTAEPAQKSLSPSSVLSTLMTKRRALQTNTGATFVISSTGTPIVITDVAALVTQINTAGSAIPWVDPESTSLASQSVGTDVDFVLVAATVLEADAGMSSITANTSILLAQFSAAGSSVEALSDVQALAVGVCTSGTTIAGSDRTASNRCSGSVGAVCTFQCLHGLRPLGQHVCGTDGSFRGGVCGRRVVQCPLQDTWETLADPCDDLIIGTDFRKPTARVDSGQLQQLQYWTDCAPSVQIANSFCRDAAPEACSLTELPLGVTNVTLQVFQPSTAVTSTCNLTVTVLDLEPPRIAKDACPSMVSTQPLLAGRSGDGSYRLVPDFSGGVRDNSGSVEILTMMDGKTIPDTDTEWHRCLQTGKHAISFVAKDAAGNSDTCLSWLHVY
jgi:hypothetical protein